MLSFKRIQWNLSFKTALKEGWCPIRGSDLYKNGRNPFHGDVKKGLV
jgi:hypothetical protein